MKNKKRVLIVTESISFGGLNLASVRFEQHLNREEFETAYCVRRSHIGNLEEEITKQGIPVYHVSDSELNYLKSYRYYKALFQKEHFDIVHCHLPFFSGIVLFAAWQCGVKKRVAHAHFSQPYTDTAIYSKKKQAVAVVYRKIMRVFLKLFCNAKIACGQEAGEFLYGKKEFQRHGIILNNGINTNDFAYNEQYRNEIREELGIEKDAVVLGHIGQLYSVKNQTFVIDVFREFYQQHKNAYLLLIGNGDDREMLEKKIADLRLKDRIKMLGLRRDVDRLYSAMDCFVFPSLHEGFPLTLVEAQASKLPCVVSDAVTRKTKLNENVSFLSIQCSPEQWCETIQSLLKTDRELIDITALLKNFDVNEVTSQLETIYLENE